MLCFTGQQKCFVIGYLHLLSSLVDIGCHLVIVSVVTGGFQCDVDVSSLRTLDWSWIQPILIVLNLGTHGFYPFPIIMSNLNSAYFEYIPMSKQPKCYPGMLHVYLVDILNFLINMIWLRLVISFISAVHKKDPEQMRMFFGLSMMKLVLQVMYLAFQPKFHTYTPDVFWLLELVDICIATSFLFIINNYTKSLRAEKPQLNSHQPPPYIECLMSTTSQYQTKEVKKEEEIVQPIENEKEVHTPVNLPA